MPCAQEEGKRGRSVSHAHPRSSGGGGGWLVDCHGEVLSSTSDPRTDDRALLPKVKGTMGVCVCVCSNLMQTVIFSSPLLTWWAACKIKTLLNVGEPREEKVKVHCRCHQLGHPGGLVPVTKGSLKIHQEPLQQSCGRAAVSLEIRCTEDSRRRFG